MSENTLVNVLSKIFDHKKSNSSKSDVGVLDRHDFDGGPVSVNVIEPGLLLGNLSAACDSHILNEYKVTHILTIDTVPLPRHIGEVQKIIKKFVQIADLPKEDIINHFEECIEFIKMTQENEGTVLVHCYFGMSRSATIVLAFLMNKYEMPVNEAFNLLKSKRNLVCPNQGFMHQLKLFEKMNYKIHKNDANYRQFRMKIAADHVKKVKILPQTSADLIKPDPGVAQVRPEPLVYRCRKCSRILASQSNIITHLNREEEMEFRKRVRKQSKNQDDDQNNFEPHDGDNLENVDKISDDETKPNICERTYFVEPLAWMKNISNNPQGKLNCPKCNNKVGSYSWTMGCQCPCGMKMAPAFYLVPSKVEWSNVVQNVQVTI